MNDDRLLAASHALRATRGGASATATETEARVVALARARQRPKRLHYLLPIAAVLAASSAWAATQPAIQVAASSAWQRLFASKPASSASSQTRAAVVQPPAPSAPIVNAPPVAPPAVTSPSAAPAPAPVGRAPAASATSRAQAAAPESTPDAAEPRAAESPPATTPLESYQEAHRLHFKSHDFAYALPAWDRYLAAVGGTGSLALEARYNRAICLARLGRREQANAALLPFARGDYGGYRQAEAQRLIDGGKLTP